VITPKTLGRILNRYSVNSVLNKDFTQVRLENRPAESDATAVQTGWVVLRQADNYGMLEASRYNNLIAGGTTAEILEKAMQEARPMATISLHATLNEAMELMEKEDCFHGVVLSPLSLGNSTLLGIVSLDDITAFYKNA
jgi:hypothetical protein